MFFIYKSPKTGYTLGMALPSNSDHQDYEPFLVGNPNLNLYVPLESSEGATPKLYAFENLLNGYTENHAFQKESPFPRVDVQVNHVNLHGCTQNAVFWFFLLQIVLQKGDF